MCVKRSVHPARSHAPLAILSTIVPEIAVEVRSQRQQENNALAPVVRENVPSTFHLRDTGPPSDPHAHPPLRFKVGDRVILKVELDWKEALVDQLWGWRDNKSVPYILKLVSNGNKYFALVDSNSTIRTYTELGLPRLLQAVHSVTHKLMNANHS